MSDFVTPGNCWVFLTGHRLSLVAGPGPVVAVASLVAEHGLCGPSSAAVACGFQSEGSVVSVHRLSCPTVYGIFSDQGSNLFPWHWQPDS